MNKKFKLELHLIPETSFGFNLRNNLGSKWTKLSRHIRLERKYTCDICSDKKDKRHTHLHEVWEFDKGIQKLIRFECICITCHRIHHWGLSEIQSYNMKALLEHACKVNGCTKAEFTGHIKRAFEVWRYRSTQKWNLDLSYMDGMKYD